MKRFTKFIAAGVLCLTASVAVEAQTTATQGITFAVSAINVISATGSSVLTVNTATPGSNPTQASGVGATTYAVTTNAGSGSGVSQDITIEINSNMPAGLTLGATLTAPTASGTSAGAVTLSTTPVTAVSGITKTAEGGLAVAYTLDATVAAGVVSSASRTVTLTIVTTP
ncbi:MAG: hypothetical protein ABJE47_07190 [bacterium]